MFTIGVFALILDEKKRILLCHRTDCDLWNLPGGGLERGEAPWQGVIREVKEETGLDVVVDYLTGVYSKPDKNEIVFNFLCKTVGGQITLTDEADQIDFFDVEAIPSNTSLKQVERIKDFFSDLDEVVLRIQSGPSTIDLINKGLLT